MELLHWFNKNYPNIVNEMKNSSHHISDEILSKYHAEGDVYTHTLMVYSHVKHNSPELKLAALLHDIGKPSCRIIKENRTEASFSFHENISTFQAIPILEKFEKDFPNVKIDKIKILKAINWHQLLHKIGSFQDNEFILEEDERQWLNHFFGPDLEMYEFLVNLGHADFKGRIANDIELLEKRYEFLQSFIPEEMYHVKENKPIAYILCGPQCAGKSTFAKELMKDKDFIYLSSDDILTKGGTELYNMVYSKKDAEKADILLFEKLKEAVKDRKNIIIDQTNTDPKGRNRKATIIPDKYYHKIVVNVLASPERIKERNASRKKEGKQIPYEAIEFKMKEFEIAGTDLFHEAITILN